MRFRINEIFYSIQGEGYHTGTPAVFIRFAGCNQSCTFCDTQHEQVNLLLSEAEIVAYIAQFPASVVILTGGEPALQVTAGLIEALHRQGLTVHIETNGTLPLPTGIDWITLSPKSKNLAITKANELKLVYEGNIESINYFYNTLKTDHHFLQPKWTSATSTNTNEVIAYIKQNPLWRLSAQVHKLLNIP